MIEELVYKICATLDIDCRGTNLFGFARELMDLCGISADAEILEIPYANEGAVIIAFRLPNDNRDYELCAKSDGYHGIAADGYWDEQGNLQLYDEPITIMEEGK